MTTPDTTEAEDVLFTKPLKQIKLIFWGPGASGKTTTLRHLSKSLHPLLCSNRIEISTSEDHTLLSDYFAFHIPLHTSTIIFHVVATTGQRRLLATREHIANGADGVLFVADSQPSVARENKRSYEELCAYLEATNRATPVVIMANKQDLPDCLQPAVIRQHLKAPRDIPVFGASALYGTAVQQVFQRFVRDALVQYVSS
jgi:signal recognition particle receptor subunit beta